MKGAPQPPQHVPLLTEVVELRAPTAEFEAGYSPLATGSSYAITEPAPLSDMPLGRHGADPSFATQPSPPGLAPAWIDSAPPDQPVLDESVLAARILADLDRQLDLMFEHRVRETLAPILARLTDALVREMRKDLSASVRDMVTRAVSLELDRHQKR